MPFRSERRRDERFRDPRLDSDHAESAGRADYYGREYVAVAEKRRAWDPNHTKTDLLASLGSLCSPCFKSNRHEIARRVSAARSYGGDGI